MLSLESGCVGAQGSINLRIPGDLRAVGSEGRLLRRQQRQQTQMDCTRAYEAQLTIVYIEASLSALCTGVSLKEPKRQAVTKVLSARRELEMVVLCK